MKLIIAEKPSLARNIVAAIPGGIMKKNKYSYTNGEYTVTWAFGHLFSLCDIEDYNPRPEGVENWTMANLPCFPKKYRFELKKDGSGKTDTGIKEQFEAIKNLCKSADTIINAGDSDREGEIIVRIIIDHALTKEEKSVKKLCRLWLPDQTAETIGKALESPGDECDYDNLAYEGYARTFIDWLYGVNLTRYATLRTGTLLRVGRVIVPIVKAIYDRDMQIEHFVPEKYYSISSSINGIELNSKKKFKKEELDKANSSCAEYNAAGAYVVSVKRKKDTINPGKLYSLSKLQSFLGKKYKMSMSDSLAAVQRLYESGYVTYPRTNSEYLASAEKDKVKEIIQQVAEVGYHVEFKDGKSIFDDSKIESHSALTPTKKIPKKDSLGPDDAKVYGAIIRRFAAVFCSEPCVADKTEIIINVGSRDAEPIEQFTIKGTVILEAGWTKYDDYSAKDRVLPKLNKNDDIPIDFKPIERETSPPKHYTIETLNNYLKNPFREDIAAANSETSDEQKDDSEDYKAIFEGLELGTEATRTGIIDNARKSRYIELNKNTYTILPDGKYMIESLSRLGIGMDKYKTAHIGRALKMVYRGEYKITQCLAIAQSEIAEVFEEKNCASPETDTEEGFYGDIVGKCPLCGENVVKGKYAYGCANYKECGFKIPLVICERVISKSNAVLLLENGISSKISGFRSKNGKLFDAQLRIKDGKTVFDFS